jgi:uncharacterized tellurite resistance protein B-like protein
MNQFLYREFAELAYAIAKADGRIQGKEIETFREVMQEEFGQDSWMATDWFEIISKQAVPTVKEAYNNVFHILKINKSEISPELKARYANVLYKMAMACGGMDEREEFLIERFKEDLKTI